MSFGQDKIIGWVFGLSCLIWKFIFSNIVLWYDIYQPISLKGFQLISLVDLLFTLVAFISIVLAGHHFMIFTDFGTEKLSLSKTETSYWYLMRYSGIIAIIITILNPNI